MSMTRTGTFTRDMLSTRVGDDTITLNGDLVAQQGIGELEIRRLLDSHREKRELFQRMTEAPEADLPRLAREVDGLEYHQQAIWRFPLDARFHLWFEVPRCTCSKLINGTMRGHTGTRAIRIDCPVHGEFVRGRAAVTGLRQEIRFRLAPAFGGREMLIVVPDGHVVVDVTPAPGAAAVLHYEDA